jgi:hypothetical protein
MGQNQAVALLTRHQKQQVIAPILHKAFGWQVETTEAFDTDRLGTFSGEVARSKTALDCALEKAQLACQLTGLRRGLGSEGSFGGGPYGDFLPWHQELVTYIDLDNNWQVSGIAHGPSFHQQQSINSSRQLQAFIDDLPHAQALVVYPKSRPANHIYKGLLSQNAILSAFTACQDYSTEPVIVEYDLRAMHCPQRLERIAEATDNLVARLRCICPKCQHPGFWPDRIVAGLPCESCDMPTQDIAKRIAECVKCHHQEVYPVDKPFADPVHCPNCNP